MTFKTDLAAIVPTATAKATFERAGVDIVQLIATLRQQAGEMQILLKQVIAIHPNDSVVSATVNAGGSGGTNGQVVIAGTTGTGTRFTARGNISGGALTGALTILTGGSYTVNPTSPGAEPVTGGGLAGATLALTMAGDGAVLAALTSCLNELT